MTLHINEAEVRQLLTMPMAIAAVEEVSRKQAEGIVVVHPRRRFELAGGDFFHYMAAMDGGAGLVAMKQYTYVKGKLCFLVPLYSTETGELLALIEADYMGQLRTGAASGVATKYLAQKLARSAAIIGTGGQARTQLEAIHSVRMLDSVYVYGRNPERRKRFCEEMSESLGINIYPMDSSTAAVQNAEIVCTATTSSQPILRGADVIPGVHINAIGANHAHIPFLKQKERWSQVFELAQLVADKAPGRTKEMQVTLFKSNGIASWDLAVGSKVYALAREKGLGRELPLFRRD